jgi:hypothetical protein
VTAILRALLILAGAVKRVLMVRAVNRSPEVRHTQLFGRHGPAGGRMRLSSGWISFAHDKGHVGFGQGIAIPHASARFTWCVKGSSGWISQTQPSAH